MTSDASMGLRATAEALANGECTSEQLIRQCIERIQALEPQIHAFVDFQPEAALQQARAADASGKPRRALHGIPIAIKEVFDVAGMRCGWGSVIHKDRVPKSDAAIVRAFRMLGAIIVGTTVSTEYAIAAAGPTVNPHDYGRSPGGSSSGSAAAVAAGMVPLALGSQSIGSVVRPASYCGVWGLKPTKGALDTEGGMALSEHLDHAGLFTRSVDDLIYTWQAFGNPHPAESSGTWPSRVLLTRGPLQHRVQPESHRALERAQAALGKAGLKAKELQLPEVFEQVEECIFTILCRDMARHHGEDRRRHGAQMSEQLRALIDRGAAIDDTHYQAALDQAQAYRQELLRHLDAPGTVLLAPATDGAAPPKDEGTGSPLLQALWTLTGLPVLAVPCRRTADLPVGVQLIAAPGREALLFDAGAMLAKCASDKGAA